MEVAVLTGLHPRCSVFQNRKGMMLREWPDLIQGRWRNGFDSAHGFENGYVSLMSALIVKTAESLC